MSKIIYIAGRVTGEQVHNLTAKFGSAQKKLEAQGYKVINPLEVVSRCIDADGHWLTTPWQEAMRYCIAALTGCTDIYMLSDWRSSRGACIEHTLAEQLHLTVHYQNN